MRFGKSGWKGYLWIILLSLAGPQIAQIGAQSKPQFPRLEPDPVIQTFIKKNQGYNAEELFDIAMWASGGARSGDKFIFAQGRNQGRKPPLQNQIAAQPANFTYRDYLNFALKKLNEGIPTNGRARAEYILEFMHKELLTNYSLNQSNIDLMLSTGVYNCVSSAVLYTILAGAEGLKTKGVITRDHAFVTVFFNENGMSKEADVETTNKYGFNPGEKKGIEKKEFNEDFKTTGFTYVPKTNYRQRETISDLELISCILQNRIKALEDKNNFYQAVPLAIDREKLLSFTDTADSAIFEDPVRMADERLMNYGAQLVNSGREDDALQWAGYISNTISNKSLLDNYLYSVLNNKISKLINSKNIAMARAVFEMYSPKLTNAANIKKLNDVINEAEIVYLVNSAGSKTGAEAALQRIAQAEADRSLDAKRISELRTGLIINEANRISRAEGSRAAVNWLEENIAKYGSNANLNSALKLYHENTARELHNQFVAIYNRQDYEGAMTFLESALKEMPDSSLLKSDYQKMRQRR